MEDFPPPLVLTRQLSANVSKQEYEDCFAHAIARVVVKAFRKKYPLEFNIQTDISQTCNKLYEASKTFFYDCKDKSCKRITLAEIRQYCNPIELNSIVLYMYIYSIIVNKYGCEGEDPYIAFNYIVDNVLYNEQYLTTQCFIDSDLCEIIKPILIDHFYKDNKYILKHNNYSYFGSHAYPTTQKTIMFNTMINPAISFFNAIQTILNKGLYLVLGINGSFIKWKEANPDKQYTIDIPIETKGHSVTIVNYDYSNVVNKSFTVKNSWGNSQLITITEQELLALTPNTWIVTSLCYLDYSPGKKEPIIVGGKTKRRKSRKIHKLKN